MYGMSSRYKSRRGYRRPSSRRRRPGSAVPWYSRKYSTLEIAQKAYSTAKYLTGLVNSEVHKFDGSNTVTPTYSGGLDNLCGIAQDDTDAGRTGNSIFVRKLGIRGIVNWNSAVAGSSQLVRLMVIIDKQQISDTAPGAADVLESTGSSQAINSFLNSATVGRFTVLKSIVLRVDADDPQRTFQMNIPLKHHIRYNGGGSGDGQKGLIYLLYVSDASTNNPSVVYSHRLSFHDN